MTFTNAFPLYYFFPLSLAEGIFLNGCLAPSLLVSFSNMILSGYKFYSKYCFSYIPQAFIWLHFHFLGVNVLHCHDYFLFVKSLVLVTDMSSSPLWSGPYPKVNHGNGGPLANIKMSGSNGCHFGAENFNSHILSPPLQQLILCQVAEVQSAWVSE